MAATVSARDALRAAKRGAKFLDEQLGRGWRRKIRRRQLDLAEPCNCVLGQLYGDYSDGAYELGLVYSEEVRLGFDSEEEEYEALTAAWLEVLRGRA